MTFNNIFLCVQFTLLCISSLFILKLQREIGLSKEINLHSKRLLEEISTGRAQDSSEYEMRSRMLATSNVGNCSAVIEQALIPVGTIIDFAGSVAPSGFLLCDGSAVSRTKYSALLDVIGITYGPGDSLTTFTLPDFRGRVSVGVGQGVGLTLRNLAGHAGEENHQLSVSELPAHNHEVHDPTHFHDGHRSWNDVGSSNNVALPAYSGTMQGAPTSLLNQGYLMDSNIFDSNSGNHWAMPSTTGISTVSQGGSQSHNIMQPYLVVSKIIKY
jgi:microcystin-dependent protein